MLFVLEEPYFTLSYNNRIEMMRNRQSRDKIYLKKPMNFY